MILSAVEESLDEDKTQRSAAAYFVSFLSLLDQAFSETGVANKELAASTIYFLDLVSPYVSHSLLRAKFTQILSKLSPVFTTPDVEAPLLRSSIGVLEILLIVQDSNGWNSGMPKRGLMGLIALALDPRPKVRKRAQEAVSNVLANPPAGPSLEHPGSAMCADFAMQSVSSLTQEHSNKSSKKQPSQSQQQVATSTKLIHTLQLVKSITSANGWPVSKLEGLCEALLSISRTSEQYLVVAAFDVFEVIFKSISSQEDASKLLIILDSIFDLKPSLNDQHLVPAWLAVIAQATESYAGLVPIDAFSKLPKIFSVVVQFLDSESHAIHVSATQCLIALVSTTIAPKVLLYPTEGDSQSQNLFNTTENILNELSQIVFGLLNIKYQASWKEVMSVLEALFERLRWRADPHLVNCFKVVGTLRSDAKLQDGREETDKVIGAAIRAFGPEKVLSVFPLNLAANNSRAWLLPLLRDNVENANLKFFTSNLVSVAGQLEAEINASGDKTKVSNAVGMKIKIFETLIDQIWTILPRFCDLPLDLKEGFDSEFAELLVSVLYKYVELRPQVCQSLKLLVESNKAMVAGSHDEDIQLLQKISKEDSKSNLEYLSKFAPNLLSALFNVFSKTPAVGRSYILECITSWLSITSASDIESTFNKVASVLHSALQEEAGAGPKKSTQKDEIPSNSTTMLDLIIPMIIYLPTSSHNALLSIYVTLSNTDYDPLLHKKAYRIISRLTEYDAGRETVLNNLTDIEKVLLSMSDKVAAPARGARIQAISKIIEILPEEHLFFIPAMLSESVLSTKDINEKTREAAFGLLVQMGKTMAKGGVIEQSKVPGMDPSSPSVNASLEEYFTMLSAGLAGSTPHMISATVTALSRVVFEFRNDINLAMLQELASTVELFLTSNNREVVKSTLGFVKITATVLPEDVVRPALGSLIEKLLVWSHEHNSHFKSKVKHIIERLIRRFGLPAIEQVFPENDMKLLTNIRKTKERAKRNKKELAAEEAEGAPTENLRNRKHRQAQAQADNEFDRAIYGSSSEDSDSDSEDESAAPTKGRNNGKANNKSEKFIVEGDEPLDLLDRQTLAHITSSKPTAQKTKLKQHFNKDAEGRIVIKDPEAGNDVKNADPLAKLTSGIDAYVEAIKNGPVRGQRNKLKFKRGKKNGEDEDMFDDEDGGKPVSNKQKLGLKKGSGAQNRGFKGKRGSGHQQQKRRFYN